MITPSAEDPSTQAIIEVTEGTFRGDTRPEQVTALIDTVGFSYSHDILQLGDPFSVTVPNPRGIYTDRFSRGSAIKLLLRNPQVNGGTQALKHTGIIVRRTASCTPGQGSTIQLECADVGWHLTNNDAWLFYKLMSGTLEQFLRDPKIIDPAWGIKMPPIADGEVSRLIRLGKNNGRAGASIALNPQFLAPLFQLQIEPGDKVADLIIAYCKRINVLVNISPDGYLQLFRPNYTQKPMYRIEFHGFGETAQISNNILDARISEDVSQIYTNVTCLGELVGTEILQVDPSNQNATKQRGDFVDSKVLPFPHRRNFCDGDMFDTSTARKQAAWFYQRQMFDSWSAQYTVRGHHQGGVWWEADTMCEVHDTILGLSGNFYVSAVRCDRNSTGDRTTVTLRKPGLLQAAYGVYSSEGRCKSSPRATATSTTNGTKTTVN